MWPGLGSEHGQPGRVGIEVGRQQARDVAGERVNERGVSGAAPPAHDRDEFGGDPRRLWISASRARKTTARRC